MYWNNSIVFDHAVTTIMWYIGIFVSHFENVVEEQSGFNLESGEVLR